MRRSFAPVVVAIAALIAAVAEGAGTPSKITRSIGAPNAGRLENGAHLEASPSIRFIGGYSTEAHYGVRELVDAIEHAAREVKRRYPDAVLGVGQLSRKGGGEIDRHHSHESGRDADLAFYLVDSFGRSVQRDRFYAIRPDGLAGSDPRLRFDDGRNWALITALVNDPRARVTHVFVAGWLRTRLLAYGARVGAPPALRSRIAELLMQPRHALPHDDHFHVRVACPWTSPQCIENPELSASKKAWSSPMQLSKLKPRAPHPPARKLVRARSTGKVPFVHTTTMWPTPGE